VSEVLEIKERINAMQNRISELEGKLFDANTFLDLFRNWDTETDAERRSRLLVQMKNLHRKVAK
jgi:hypothetical protein